jgi:hypothetical protein
MKPGEREQKWLATIRRLEAAYAALGKEALGKLTAIEAQVLYAEKLATLKTVSKRVSQYPHDELGQLLQQKLQRETAEIGGWMRDNCRAGCVKAGPELER